MSEEYKNLVDVLVYDALACNSEWLNACIEAKIHTVIRVKSNNIKSIKEVKRLVNKSEPGGVWTGIKDYESIIIYEGDFYINNVEKELRFIKYNPEIVINTG